MARAVMRPLAAGDRMQPRAEDGAPMEAEAAGFIKPSAGLTSFERLEIYNRQYWFRLLGCFHDDYPGLRAVLGAEKFDALARAYLTRHPSRSFSLRNLGERLELFLRAEPQWAGPHGELALDMARFEWAQIVAFDGPAESTPTAEELQMSATPALPLRLQPYLSLLELRHAVDEFSQAVKSQDALRKEASNAFESAPESSKFAANTALPPREDAPIHLAVHRYENSVFSKRLEPAAYRILCALRDGATLGAACESAGSEAAGKIEGWFANWSALGWFYLAADEAKEF